MSEAPSQQDPNFYDEVLWNMKSEQEHTESKDWFDSVINYEAKYDPFTDTAKQEFATAADVFGAACEQGESQLNFAVKSESTCMKDDHTQRRDVTNTQRRDVTNTTQRRDVTNVTNVTNTTDYAALENEIFINSSGKSAAAVGNQSTFSCKLCNFTFNSDTAFTEHNMNAHNRYACSMCIYSCSDETVLKGHLLMHSSNDLCSQPEYKHLLRNSTEVPLNITPHRSGNAGPASYTTGTFTVESSVNTLIRSCNEELFGPYSCTVCDYNCTDETIFKGHLLLHSGAECLNSLKS